MVRTTGFQPVNRGSIPLEVPICIDFVKRLNKCKFCYIVSIDNIHIYNVLKQGFKNEQKL